MEENKRGKEGRAVEGGEGSVPRLVTTVAPSHSNDFPRRDRFELERWRAYKYLESSSRRAVKTRSAQKTREREREREREASVRVAVPIKHPCILLRRDCSLQSNKVFQTTVVQCGASIVSTNRKDVQPNRESRT